jgi:hypothetical protein
MKTFSRTRMSAREFHHTPERLESRIAPAVIVSVLDLDGDGAADDIRIVGDVGKNIVTVQDNGANQLTISIDADGNGNTTGPKDLAPTNYLFSGDSVALDVKLGAGNDTLNYTTTGNLSASTRMLNADLGPGSNTFSFSTGAFNVLNSSRIGIDVTGGTAVDAVTVDFNEVRKSALTVSLALGRGNDTATVNSDKIDDGSSGDVGVDLGIGVNTLTVDLQEVGFGDRATVNVDVTGGVHKDTVTLNLHDDVGNGVTASALNFKADLGAGNDVFAANVDYQGNVFRVDDHSVASIAVKGGAGNDSLSVTGVGVGAAGTIKLDADSTFAIDLQGGAGNDIINVDLGKTDALELIGALRLRLAGGLGNDVLTAMVANNAVATGNYDLAVLGDQGNDQATFQVTNNGGTPTFGPTGKALLDGGLGTDILTNNSKPLSKATGFEQVI